MQLLQVLYSPADAFTSLRGKKMAWILATVVLIVLSVVTIGLMLNRFSTMDIMEHQIAQSGQDVPSQNLEQMAGFVTATMYGGAVISTPIMILIAGLILLAIVKGFSGETSYPMMLNAASYAMVGFSIVSTLLLIVMLYTASDLQTFQLENPIPLNAGYFFTKEDVGKAGVAFLSGINLLNFYLMYLLALGAAKLSDRVTTGKVLGPLVGIYVLYILGKTGFAAIF